MSGRPPLVLLPPSKGKSDDEGGPAYRDTIDLDHPLGAARLEVLEHLESCADELDDEAVVRVAGVRREYVEDGRRRLRELATLGGLPARERYTGIVHGNADLAQATASARTADGLVISAVLGLVDLEEPVPSYRVEFPASIPGLGGLATYWRDAAADHLASATADRAVWDLLPGEHARIWSNGAREVLDHRPVVFVRPDGRPANAARTKVAKGRLAGWLLRHAGRSGALGADAAEVAREVDLGEGWTLTAAQDGPGLVATYAG